MSNEFLMALIPLFPSIQEECDPFAEMSPEAQDIVVNAALGLYKDGPPEMSESVRKEIMKWANTPE